MTPWRGALGDCRGLCYRPHPTRRGSTLWCTSIEPEDTQNIHTLAVSLRTVWGESDRSAASAWRVLTRPSCAVQAAHCALPVRDILAVTAARHCCSHHTCALPRAEWSTVQGSHNQGGLAAARVTLQAGYAHAFLTACGAHAAHWAGRDEREAAIAVLHMHATTHGAYGAARATRGEREAA